MSSYRNTANRYFYFTNIFTYNKCVLLIIVYFTFMYEKISNMKHTKNSNTAAQ